MLDVIQFGSSICTIHLRNRQLIAMVMMSDSHNSTHIGHIKNRSPREVISCTQRADRIIYAQLETNRMGLKDDHKKTQQHIIQDDLRHPHTIVAHFFEGVEQPTGIVFPFPIAHEKRLGHV